MTRRRNQLLIYARGGVLLLYDMATRTEVVQYKGATNKTSLLPAVFSPDGRLVLAGGEQGNVAIWDAWSGDRISHVFTELRFTGPLMDISWNPCQHCVALAACGGNFPVVVSYSNTSALGGITYEQPEIEELDMEEEKYVQAREKLDRSKRVKEKLEQFKKTRKEKGSRPTGGDGGD